VWQNYNEFGDLVKRLNGNYMVNGTFWKREEFGNANQYNQSIIKEISALDKGNDESSLDEREGWREKGKYQMDQSG